MRAPCLFKVTDATRFCKGITNAGLMPTKVRVLPDGTLEADIANGTEIVQSATNEWDEVLLIDDETQ